MIELSTTITELERLYDACSICGLGPIQYLKGEYFLCEACYPIIKGLYSKQEIEQAIAERRKQEVEGQ